MSALTIAEPRTPRPAYDAGRDSRPRQIRLTRRGRVAVLLTSLAVVFAALVVFGPSVVASTQSSDPVPVRTVTVLPGQTMWDIASAANPDGDIRQTVYEIAELNALPSAGRLQTGQTIAVPRY